LIEPQARRKRIAVMGVHHCAARRREHFGFAMADVRLGRLQAAQSAPTSGPCASIDTDALSIVRPLPEAANWRILASDSW
jgi:hypothetical protein